jgi:vitamin B12 transporter
MGLVSCKAIRICNQKRVQLYDVGFDLQPSTTSLIRFSFFVNDIQNLLSYNIIDPAFPQDVALQEKFDLAEGDRLRVNFPQVKTSGFEMSANWQFIPHWTLFATETYTDARVSQGFKETLTQTQFPLVPFHSGRAGVSYDDPSGLRFALFVNFQGLRSVDTVHIGPPFAREPDPQGNEIANIAYLPPGTLLPGYATLDLSFRLPITETTALTGYLNNLTSVAYERYYGNGGPPLNFKVGLQVSF